MTRRGRAVQGVAVIQAVPRGVVGAVPVAVGAVRVRRVAAVLLAVTAARPDVVKNSIRRSISASVSWTSAHGMRAVVVREIERFPQRRRSVTLIETYRAAVRDNPALPRKFRIQEKRSEGTIMKRMCMCVVCAAVAALLSWFVLCGSWLSSISAQEKGASGPSSVSFIRDVAPILKENCFACHDAKKKSGKYDMTTFEKLMAGGVNGEAVIPGKPEESELYTLMVSQEERRMPPRDKGEAVPASKAEVVKRWIAEGAKLDAGIAPGADLSKELRVRWQPPRPPEAYPYPALVNAVAFAPDGKHLVTSGYHELLVWEWESGRLVRRLRTRSERTYGLVFLPDGKLVAAGGRPGQEGDVRAYRWDGPGMEKGGVVYLDGVEDGRVLVKHLFDTEDAVLCVAATGDGKWLAAGGCDRSVRVFDLSRGVEQAELVQTVENHADWVLGCALTADGQYLLTASRDKTAKVWDLKARESVVTFPEHQNIVYGVAVKPDGSAGYSVGADRQLRVWNPKGEGKQVSSSGGHTDEVYKVAINGAGTHLATGGADRSVRLWDVSGKGKVATVRQWGGLSDHVFAVAFSADGRHVAAGCYDGTVAVWKTGDGSLVRQWNATPGLKGGSGAPVKK
ncbi:c-type cytochrome domain-containing protein [Thermogemmata fonticola]|nr:c-type cytochrome domain-containing protein [Thermogemmata fonticola]